MQKVLNGSIDNFKSNLHCTQGVSTVQNYVRYFWQSTIR